MGTCSSKQTARNKLLEPLINDLEGGDDDVELGDEKRRSTCCFCCGGGDDLMKEDGGLVEHNDDDEDIADMNEEDRRKIRAIGSQYGDQGVGAGADASDNREPVDLDETPMRASVARTCYVSCSDGFGKSRGSGIILDWNINGKEVKFLMTAAHCLADAKMASKTGRVMLFKSITCYQLYDGGSTYAEKYKVLSAHVHPAWGGSPIDGFDYGIGILGAPQGGRDKELPEQIYDDYFVAQVSKMSEDIIKGQIGKVIGYPASWENTMTQMSGPFRGVKVVKKKGYEGHCLLYDIDQTGGNSGGPVFTEDPDFVEQLKKEKNQGFDTDDNMVLMGIVSGAGKTLNAATLITPEIMQWTLEKLQENSDNSGADTLI